MVHKKIPFKDWNQNERGFFSVLVIMIVLAIILLSIASSLVTKATPNENLSQVATRAAYIAIRNCCYAGGASILIAIFPAFLSLFIPDNASERALIITTIVFSVFAFIIVLIVAIVPLISAAVISGKCDSCFQCPATYNSTDSCENDYPFHTCYYTNGYYQSYCVSLRSRMWTCVVILWIEAVLTLTAVILSCIVMVTIRKKRAAPAQQTSVVIVQQQQPAYQPQMVVGGSPYPGQAYPPQGQAYPPQTPTYPGPPQGPPPAYH